MLKLVSGDVELAIDPWIGGGIASFSWRGRDIFRPHNGASNPTDLANFPLVPFCNRIAHGRMTVDGELRNILMSRKGIEEVHAIHGLGWVSPWATCQHLTESADLSLHHDGSIWPWAFDAEQHIQVSEDGYSHTLSVTNRGRLPMPAGLGLHPYFPRQDSELSLDVKGVWHTGKDRLPSTHRRFIRQPAWFAESGFDNCFTGRTRPIEITWPTHKLTITPCENLPFTHVYSPPGEDYFCAEPVSHIPDAMNSTLAPEETGLTTLQPGETFEVRCDFQVEEVR